MRYIVIVGLAISLLVVSSSFLLYNPEEENTSDKDLPVYVGVSFCGNTTNQAKALSDKTKNYTNLCV